MMGFGLTLLDSRGTDEFDEVIQFIGSDDSGSFGILARHERTVSLLRFGLARFFDKSGRCHYVALPGGVLRFADNHLTVTTVRYFLGDDRAVICQQLDAEMTKLDSEVHSARATLSEIEHSLVKRLSQLSGRGAGEMA
ncbi:F0F1 ATP synthase subunit epsilon [Methylomonas sp. MgM2]